MSTSGTRNRSRNQSNAGAPARAEKMESPQEFTHDVVDYLTEYARDKPGYAALWCLGVGFILGWKLKPW